MSGSVALGRDLRRLLPEDAFDQQPASSRNGRYTLVADIRLDNRPELTDALGIGAGQAARLSDSALLLQAIERWDLGAVDRLTGVFAIALWDAHLRRMHLVRDPLGMRPLYFHQSEGCVAFASMPCGLHALPEIPYAVDEERVSETLIPMSIATERTFFRDIRSVLPGHVFTFAAGALTRVRYWRPEEIATRRQTREQSAESVREAFDRAVAAQLRGEGEVMSQLSGGMDSTLVTATAARILRASNRRLIGVTAAPYPGFAGEERRDRMEDESGLASQTAAFYPEMEHLVIRPPMHVSPLAESMPGEALLGRPRASPCNQTWLTAINQEAQRRGIAILLDGVPGNMTVSHPGLDAPMDLARRGHLLRAGQEVLALVRQHRLRPRGAVGLAARALLPPGAWRWVEAHTRRAPDYDCFGAVHPDRMREWELLLRTEALGRSIQADGLGRKIAVFEMTAEAGPLRKGNLAAWDVDERSPLGDRRVIEACLSIPAEHYLENGQTCALHRRAFGERLPSDLYRVRARGLQAADWWDRLDADRTGVANELDAMRRSPLTQHFIDVPRIAKYVGEWPTDRHPGARTTANYRMHLLRAVAMSRFLRMVEAGRPSFV